MQAASRATTNRLIADLRKRRDEFQQRMKAVYEAGATAWPRDRAELESRFDGFSAEVNKHLEALGQDAAAQQAVFRDRAAAQQKAWHEAAEQLHGAAAEFAADRRTEIQRAVERMKADASQMQARLQKAGENSWAALNTALTDARAAFDRAVQTAGKAFTQAAKPARKQAVKPAAKPAAKGTSERPAAH